MAEYYINNKEQQVLSGVKFRKDNPGYRSQYYVNNRDLADYQNREWQKSNKDKKNAANRKRRAMKLNQMGFMPSNHEYIMINIYGSKFCMKCGSMNKVHIDHIKPVSKGGLWCLSNFQFLCETCNISKSNKHDTDYRTSCQKYDMMTYMLEMRHYEC